MDLCDLERRISMLEDLEAIKNLKAQYCAHLDERDTAASAELFVEDGVWDGGETFGRYEGRTAIRKFFHDVQEDALRFSLHYVSNPYLELRAAGVAYGCWYLFMPCTYRDQAVWGAGRYEDLFVKVGERWLAKEMKVVSHFWTPFDRGWVEQRALEA